MNTITVITGPSGSGKSTIGDIIRHRFKDVHVIDTDDIDDTSFLELYYHNDDFRNMIDANTGESTAYAYKLHMEENKKRRDQIIKDYYGLKHLVFVGLTLQFDDIKHKGYFLDTPLDFNYRVVNKRTLKDICKNSSKLDSLIDNAQSPMAFEQLTLFRFKIRHQFPIFYEQIKNSYDHFRSDAEKRGYTVMTGSEIINDLARTLTLLINVNVDHSVDKKQNVIIHVSGVQGSGKTHMGDKLALYYGNIIHIKDLDNLYGEFLSTDMTNYQGFIDDYITKHNDKPIVFVGLDAELCLGPRSEEGKKKQSSPIYNLHAKYQFFIDESDTKILQQRFRRQIQKLSDRNEEFFIMWTTSPKQMQEKLIRYVDISSWADNNKQCRDFHVKRGYTLLSYIDIVEEIKKILQNAK